MSVERDPNTGQFRSTSGGSLEHRDFEYQSFRCTFRSNAENLPDPSATVSAQVLEADPAGGIERDEAAELVAFFPWYQIVEVDEVIAAQATGAQGAMRGAWELSLDDDPDLASYTKRNTRNFTVEDDPDAGGTGTEFDAVSRRNVTDNPDVLWYTRTRADGARDGANSSDYIDQGSPQPTGAGVVNFRRETGRGPVLLQRDEWYLHGQLNWVNTSDLNLVSEIAGQLIWAIHDRDAV